MLQEGMRTAKGADPRRSLLGIKVVLLFPIFPYQFQTQSEVGDNLVSNVKVFVLAII
jgi:hypothetical protein